ncbi:diguanylate cyclase domain-containing protein [Klebsiella quasipneumoniae]|uniref:diguanylate cyclase domain-containing protein n=1 Tax=Klebsiella quasipneumoniae TaxID=1463165 RepID=UPI0034E06CA0
MKTQPATGETYPKSDLFNKADQVRRDDIVARTGGEEFALLLSDVGQQQAQLIAERTRQTIINPGDVSSRVKLPESVTISIGLATTEDPKTV